MTGLKKLQESFQAAVLTGDASILSDITPSDREKREVLLGVYQNAYRLNLIEFLDNEYEKLGLLLGDDGYAEMVQAYIANTLPDTPNARDYGRKLPEFLREHAPFSDARILGDMADFERALNHAFDAANDQPLTLEDLASVPPEGWPDKIFAPHASVTRLDLKTNAQGIWQAFENEIAPPAINDGEEPDRVIVYRQDLRSMFRSMVYEEAMLWDELVKGVNFAGLNELSATYGGEEEAAIRVAGYLKGWIECEMLRA